MPAKKGTTSAAAPAKAAAPAAAGKKPAAGAKKAPAKAAAPAASLFDKRPRSFGIGGNIQPKRDLSRFVRWPRYIKLQRQRRILMTRLKVPPTINQFTHTLDKNTARQLFKLLSKYRPETRKDKKQRLFTAAKAKADAEKAGQAAPADKATKPSLVKYGINHITKLVEQKKAKLVVIAHDVDPIEIVVWLPTLCRKMDVPYVIVKGKARLGTVVHKKTATALALTTVRKEDAAELQQLAGVAREQFNNNAEARKQWGGGRVGPKAQAVIRKREKALAKEETFRQVHNL
jgi:large subunit ribosomal protein L7Ae